MLTPLIIKHISSCNLLDWLIQKLTFRKYQMDVIIGLTLVMVECRNAFHLIFLLKMVCKPFQQILWFIMNKRFRQSNNQFPCLNTSSFSSTLPKAFLITLCQFSPKTPLRNRSISGIQILLLCLTRYISNSS